MTKQNKIFFCAIAIVLLCLLVTAFGPVAICPAAAADINTSTPAAGSSGQLAPYEISSSLSLAPQSTSTIADPQSQTPTIPLVPFQLTVANQTVSEPASLSVLATVGASQTPGAPSANAAAGNAAPPADAITQPTTNNGSPALIPVSVGAGGSGLILVSYGTAIVVLGVMRYWSISFDDAADSSFEVGDTSPEFHSESVGYARDSAYSTIDIVEYGYTAEGQ